jgi:prophage regulatory protein
VSGEILRLPEVLRRTGLGRSSLYLAMARRTFPPSVRLGQRSVGWDSRAVESWIDARITESREEAKPEAPESVVVEALPTESTVRPTTVPLEVRPFARLGLGAKRMAR